MKKRFSEEQIVAILREGQSGEKTVEQLCRAHGIATPTYYGWRRRYGSMAEPEVRRPRELEKENARLKRLPAERDLELDVVKEFLPKKVADVAGRRPFVGFARGREVSASRACGLAGVSRRRLGYVSRSDDVELVAELKGLAAARPRYGCRGFRLISVSVKRTASTAGLRRA